MAVGSNEQWKEYPASTVFAIDDIAAALADDGALLAQWAEHHFVPLAVDLCVVARRLAVRELQENGGRWIGAAKQAQGEWVRLDLRQLRDPCYFIEHWQDEDTDKPYLLVRPKGYFNRERRLLPRPGDDSKRARMAFQMWTPRLHSFVDLGEYAKGIHIEVRGMKGVRTLDPWEVYVYPSDGSEEMSLPVFCKKVMERHDRTANAPRETDADSIYVRTFPDYSLLRRELLESIQPVDQLLSLYMLGSAQEGNRQMADRIVFACTSEWLAAAKVFCRDYESSLTRHGIEPKDVESYARLICVANLMGNSIDSVESAKKLQRPFNITDTAPFLNLATLLERHALAGEYPRLYLLATLIYLNSRVLGPQDNNTEPGLTEKGGPPPLSSLDEGQIRTVIESCAYCLVESCLTDIITARDIVVNKNRFNLSESNDLGTFFKIRVKHTLIDALIRKKTPKVDFSVEADGSSVSRKAKKKRTEGGARIEADEENKVADELAQLMTPSGAKGEVSGLEELGLPLGRLSQRERQVVLDVLEGLRKGYEFSSKQGGSFKQLWDKKEYEANKKAWDRAKSKLRGPSQV